MPRTISSWLFGPFAVLMLSSISAKAQGTDPPKKLTNEIGMRFVWIPPGSFQMGSPPDEEGRRKDETQHLVTLTEGFYLGVYHVTQEQWQAVMGDNPSVRKGERELPVDNVSWDDCQVFLEKMRKGDGREYRLPTEAEWEYACRAGTKTAFFCGDDLKELGRYAWHDWNAENKTHPVGQKKPNAWGLHDMHGNLWQWCADFYADYPSRPANNLVSAVSPPSAIAELVAKLSGPIYKERQAATKALKEIGAPALGSLRTALNDGPDLETRVRARKLIGEISESKKNIVLRGGSYSVLPWTVRAAFRNYNLPWHRNANYGVRVAIAAAER